MADFTCGGHDCVGQPILPESILKGSLGMGGGVFVQDTWESVYLAEGTGVTAGLGTGTGWGVYVVTFGESRGLMSSGCRSSGHMDDDK